MLAVLMLNRMRNRRQNIRKKLTETTKKLLSKDVIEVTEQFVEYCRTCLSSNELVDIFYSEETARKRSEDLELVAGVKIILNDGLSQKMCTKCIETLNLALHFRIISAKNDEKLRKVFQDSNKIFAIDTEAEYSEEYEVLDSENENESYNFNNDNIEANQGVEYIEDYTDYEYLNIDMEHEVNKKKQIQSNSDTQGTPDSICYKCHVCGKEYSRRHTYKAHVRSHTNYYVCEDCGKRYSSNSMLLSHQRALHGLPRVHLCAYCDYTSATRAGLLVHERRHTGEREFVCEHCGASFHSRGGLVQHLPIHLPDSNFECEICHKREKSRRLLQHHYHKVHREKSLRYLCPVCQNVFKSSSGARYHLAKSHGVPRALQPALQRFKISIPDRTQKVN